LIFRKWVKAELGHDPARYPANLMQEQGMANESTAKSRSGAGEPETLEAQIETLKSDIAAISATLADLVKSSVREGRSKAERTAQQYLRQGQEQADAAVESARAYGEALEEQISRNPFTAVLVALGLGYLVGLMSRR
jgi:ElaB/YqjD/DUF883 family membrane-anchored ribosome-binding protein